MPTQSEALLENSLVNQLSDLGYENVNVKNEIDLKNNFKKQLEKFNEISLTDSDFDKILTYLESGTIFNKAEKLRDRFVIQKDNKPVYIKLFNTKDWCKNNFQVTNQVTVQGKYENRYDVTILINGLPLVQIELKRRGSSLKKAFNQIGRYHKHSYGKLFDYIQVFVISNGVNTKYFTNNKEQNFKFTFFWKDKDNKNINQLDKFTDDFLDPCHISKMIAKYIVLNQTTNSLMILRSYQYYAVEALVDQALNTNNNGYIWHTTGSGKTLTSFKASQILKEESNIDKVIFVVDRKDLDYQTMKEYQRFSPDSVNGSENTAGLKRNIEKDDNKIIVTTIQKLNNLIKGEMELPIYNKQVVFIFDEAHRSQFGEAQKNINKKFKRYYQFGFTGTPIFPENALGAETTASVFGRELHSYVITDAIRDEKVLKFKVDYNDVRPKFKSIEMEQDEKKLTDAENKEALLHPERIKEVSQYILNNFRVKTHRSHIGTKGFNAMFAVSSVDAAKLYYESLNDLQKDSNKPIKIATIFSFAANEEQSAIGEILDESFEPTAMDSSAKEFLSLAIKDYDKMFSTNFGDSKEFQNYYRDLANRVKKQEIDLLIVVGMFLTGFDAPTLNTLFVDKNLRYHGLMQAFSRTNRIYDSTKTFGNIVAFRNLEQATIDAIKCFGDNNTKNVVLEKSYKEYMKGFTDISTGEARRGYVDVVEELNSRFPNVDAIVTEKDKKAFVKLFGEYLKVENILQNYDEFTNLKALQSIDIQDLKALEEFKANHYVSDEDLEAMKGIVIPDERIIQDYRSTYNDIRDWLRREKAGKDKESNSIDWDDIVFEIDLLKSQEINLDYILELIFEKNKKVKDKGILVEEIRRIIRSSIGNRAKESLVVDFINQTDLDDIQDKASIIDSFFSFAQKEQKREAEELINEENLNVDAAKRYILSSLKKEYASENGTEINEILPRMSPLNPKYLTKKQSVFQKISNFIEKFKGVGGVI